MNSFSDDKPQVVVELKQKAVGALKQNPNSPPNIKISIETLDNRVTPCASASLFYSFEWLCLALAKLNFIIKCHFGVTILTLDFWRIACLLELFCDTIIG